MVKIENEFNKIKNAVEALHLDKLDSCYVVKISNIDDVKCWESLEVWINGQLYFSVTRYLHLSFRIVAVEEIEECPIFSVIVQNMSQVEFYRSGRGLILQYDSYREESQVDKIIKEVFGRLTAPDTLKKKDDLVNEFNEYFGQTIVPNDVGYDLCNNYFYIKDWKQESGIEASIIKAEFDKFKSYELEKIQFIGDKCILAKYTSLDTLMKILDTEKLRMYSLSGMNDRKEIGFLTSNESSKDEDLTIDEKLKFRSVLREANKRFITSLSSSLDNLKMWRLYGDDAQGVSIEFAVSKDMLYLYPVFYNGKQLDPIGKIMNFKEIMKNKGIGFNFLSLRNWQYFIKPDCFDYENEFRILLLQEKIDGWDVTKTGVITPYINYKLNLRYSSADLPDILIKRIVLGPNMKEKERNEIQIALLMKSKNLRYIEVVKSKIDSYI